MKAVDLKNVRPHPALKAKMDETFMELLQSAIGGKVSIYFAQVPFRLIRPFDESFLPQLLHADGQRGIQFMTELIKQGNGPAVWVYPKGGMFILSDDYHLYEASRVAKAEFVPCLVMGKAAAHGVERIEGPLSQEEILDALGVVRKEKMTSPMTAKLTKKCHAAAPEGEYLVSNVMKSYTQAIFEEVVSSPATRDMQWARIVSAKANHRSCRVFKTKDEWDAWRSSVAAPKE